MDLINDTLFFAKLIITLYLTKTITEKIVKHNNITNLIFSDFFITFIFCYSSYNRKNK